MVYTVIISSSLTKCLFWQVVVKIFEFLCVGLYEMKIVFILWNGEMLVKWDSEQL